LPKHGLEDADEDIDLLSGKVMSHIANAESIDATSRSHGLSLLHNPGSRLWRERRTEITLLPAGTVVLDGKMLAVRALPAVDTPFSVDGVNEETEEDLPEGAGAFHLHRASDNDLHSSGVQPRQFI
jgi:hypothetical protein